MYVALSKHYAKINYIKTQPHQVLAKSPEQDEDDDDDYNDDDGIDDVIVHPSLPPLGLVVSSFRLAEES